MADHPYDIAIIGLGAAGCQIVNQLTRHHRDAPLEIVVIDDFKAKCQEKTWSYWETGKGDWDDVIEHHWHKGIYRTSEGQTIELGMAPYIYKSVNNQRLVRHVRELIELDARIDWVDAHVMTAEELDTHVVLHTSASEVRAKTVLDSRITNRPKKKGEIDLLQHFLGWEVQTNGPAFDPDIFTMMDFSISQGEATRFMYVLPYAEDRALVECTYFSSEVVEDEVYEEQIRAYLAQDLELSNYDILQVEQGVIPMTTRNFDGVHTSRILKIGTAGGWVKASTGYSFKRSEALAIQLVHPLIKKGTPRPPSFSRGYELMDATLLDILDRHNDYGPQIFDSLFGAHPTPQIFRFLDETSSIADRLKIGQSLASLRFIHAFFRQVLRG